MKCGTSGILPVNRHEQNEVEDLKKSNSRIKSMNRDSPSQEWLTEWKRLGYVCNVVGTETSHDIPSPQLLYRLSPLSENLSMHCTCCLVIPVLWSVAAGCNHHMPMSIASFILHSKWIGLSKWDPNSLVITDVTSPFPPSGNETRRSSYKYKDVLEKGNGYTIHAFKTFINTTKKLN